MSLGFPTRENKGGGVGSFDGMIRDQEIQEIPLARNRNPVSLSRRMHLEMAKRLAYGFQTDRNASVA
jgi:hypothetical protein